MIEYIAQTWAYCMEMKGSGGEGGDRCFPICIVNFFATLLYLVP